MLCACSSATRASAAPVRGDAAPPGAAEAGLQPHTPAALPARPRAPRTLRLSSYPHVQWPGVPPRSKCTQLVSRQIVVSRLPPGATAGRDVARRSPVDPTPEHSSQCAQSFQDSAVLDIASLSSSTSRLYSN